MNASSKPIQWENKHDMRNRKKRVASITKELVLKSREAALSAVQIFNNPLIKFKSEAFIVLMIISWTYLLHAYYRKEKINYKCIKKKGKKKNSYEKTPEGAIKYLNLLDCLNKADCPLDKETVSNLKFLTLIRHEIEHRMTTRLDDQLGAKFQACCLNYNRYVKEIFGKNKGIDSYLSISLQFSSVSQSQKDTLLSNYNLPKNIQSFISEYEQKLGKDIYNHPNYAYRVIFTQKLVNHKNQADQVIEFVKPESKLGVEINQVYIQEKDKDKYLPKQIVEIMKKEGYIDFTITKHTYLWKSLSAKGNKRFGVYPFQGKRNWAWYSSWLEVVRSYCKKGYLIDEVVNKE